jgi:hypothetical protein
VQKPWHRYDYKIPKAARVGFFAGMPPPDDLDCLSHAELKGLVVKQWEQMVELQRLVAALRDEIARFKGGPGRPNLKPSGMERGTEPKPPGTSGGRKRPLGSTRSKLAIDEERTPPRPRDPASKLEDRGAMAGNLGLVIVNRAKLRRGSTQASKTTMRQVYLRTTTPRNGRETASAT